MLDIDLNSLVEQHFQYELEEVSKVLSQECISYTL
uniref:Uncharacterized protein n=1 Tax=Arundo donax TaxID=35708 RepID=A0A0A9AS56_ARUDO